MPEAPNWVDEIREAVDKVVLADIDLTKQTSKETETEDGQTSHTIIVGNNEKPIQRHLFMLAIDTTEMKETEEDERTVISGLQVNELMMGNVNIIIACLIQFMKSEKVRPLLLKAMMEGMDLGGFEKSVLPGNVGALLDTLMGGSFGRG
jgi:hypothetical protein